MRASEYARLAKSLDEFLTCYALLLADLEPVARYGVPAQYVARSGREHQANSTSDRLAKLAGAAADAFDASGVEIDWSPPGTMQYRGVNPALTWSTIASDRPMYEADLVTTVGLQALGRLESLRDTQIEREKGFVGALGWFFSLPSQVRAAAGLSRLSAGGVVVAWTTAVIQGLIITVLGGLIVAGVLAVLG